jgi:hypothetical protein
MRSKINNVRIGDIFLYKIDDDEWIIFKITKTTIGFGHRYYHWMVIDSHSHRTWGIGDDHYNWIASTFNNREVIKLTGKTKEEIAQILFMETM